MAEYIDRDAVKKVFEDFGKPLVMAPGFAARQIGAIPAADVVPVVRGRWVGGYHTRKGRWVYAKPCCSLCSFEQNGISNYCPNCGARMDGDSDEG